MTRIVCAPTALDHNASCRAGHIDIANNSKKSQVFGQHGEFLYEQTLELLAMDLNWRQSKDYENDQFGGLFLEAARSKQLLGLRTIEVTLVPDGAFAQCRCSVLPCDVRHHAHAPLTFHEPEELTKKTVILDVVNRIGLTK